MTTTKIHRASWALAALALASLAVLTSSCSANTTAVPATLREQRKPSTSSGTCAFGCPCQLQKGLPGSGETEGFCADCPGRGCLYCPHDLFCPENTCEHAFCAEPDPYLCPDDSPVNCGDGNCCPEDFPVCCPGGRCTDNDTCDE